MFEKTLRAALQPCRSERLARAPTRLPRATAAARFSSRSPRPGERTGGWPSFSSLASAKNRSAQERPSRREPGATCLRRRSRRTGRSRARDRLRATATTVTSAGRRGCTGAPGLDGRAQSCPRPSPRRVPGRSMRLTVATAAPHEGGAEQGQERKHHDCASDPAKNRVAAPSGNEARDHRRRTDRPHIGRRRKRGTPSSFITTRNISSASDRSVSGTRGRRRRTRTGAPRKF